MDKKDKEKEMMAAFMLGMNNYIPSIKSKSSGKKVEPKRKVKFGRYKRKKR